MLCVFGSRRCANNLNFTAGQRRFQDITSVHSALRGSSTYNQVQLVNKDNGLAVVFEFGHDLFQSLFKFTAVFRPGNHTGQIEHHNPLIQQTVGHILGNNTLGEAFHNGSLTYTRLTNQYWVILGASVQNSHHALNLVFSAHHRIKLAFTSLCGQIGAKEIQRSFALFLGAAARFRGTFTAFFILLPVQELLNLIIQRFHINVHIQQKLGGTSILLTQNTVENVLSTGIFLAELLGNFLRHFERELGSFAQTLTAEVNNECFWRQVQYQAGTVKRHTCIR